MHDGLQVQLLGGDERKTLPQIKPHLVTKYRQRAGAGAVGFMDALMEDAIEKLMILAHGALTWLGGKWN